MAPPQRTGPCPNGHLLSEAYRRQSDGYLVCRPCRRATKKRHRATHWKQERAREDAANRRYRARHPARNRIRVRIKNARRAEEYKRRLIKLKGGQCQDCKELFVGHPEVFDFDHLKDKEAIISKLIRRASWERVLKEADKCELVCSNCHRVRTKRRTKELKRA